MARATESALRGERHEADDVSGDLWSAQLIGEGVEHASVDLVLVSSGDRLDLQVSFEAAGDKVTAVLTEASGSRSVQLDRSWREALLGSRACYSYSVLQTRLKNDRDLQAYLEELLVLGPVWQSVRTALVRRAEDATAAKKAVEKACTTVKAAEASLRERFLADPRSPTVPRDIVWPSAWTDDADEWLVANELTCAVDERPIPVSDDHERRVEALRSALHVAEQRLSAADDVTAQLHAALRAMLPDADVEIDKIQHQGGAKNRRGAQVRLTLAGLRGSAC